MLWAVEKVASVETPLRKKRWNKDGLPKMYRIKPFDSFDPSIYIRHEVGIYNEGRHIILSEESIDKSLSRSTVAAAGKQSNK